MAADVVRCYPSVDPSRLRVIHNGIDTDEYKPTPAGSILQLHGIDPDRPMVVFVGRITRQKGLPYLLQAAHHFDRDVQLVLLASSPDTPEIRAEVATGIDSLKTERDGVFWISEMVPKKDLIELFTAATVFVCPSIYEPLGIVNLEAMACETAVVASAIGGIPEVVEDGRTGLLVDYDADRPAEFEAKLSAAVNALVRDPDRARAMGIAGRERAVREFSWAAIAQQTVDLYQSLLS
jgi:starch synthase